MMVGKLKVCLVNILVGVCEYSLNHIDALLSVVKLGNFEGAIFGG